MVDGRQVQVPDDGTTLLDVLRDGLGLRSPKDGCSPQGQCGCCTVLVDGSPRVACVTPARRVAGRTITTVDGLPDAQRATWAGAFCATGGSQCGFCTPGIVVRLAGLAAKGGDPTDHAPVERALQAHLCRCTGWQTIVEAWDLAAGGSERPDQTGRDLDAASRRATIEGRAPQRVSPDVALGRGGFADDTAPAGALVALRASDGSWVVGEDLAEARALAAKVQGRRTTVDASPPITLPDGDWVAALRTQWVEPAYLETDASWCEPGGEPASPLANGGAFGAKVDSPVRAAARELADRFGRAVRVVFSREDVVRLGPKRPPIAASARYDASRRTLTIVGMAVGPIDPFAAPIEWPYRVDEVGEWSSARVPGPATSTSIRAVGLAERAVLLEGAFDAAAVDRASLVRDDRVARTLLDTCAPGSFDRARAALAGA